MSKTSDEILKITDELKRGVRSLKFAAPVTHVYNPLEYAGKCHAQYIRRFATGKRRVVFLGMNPGPFGMAQTGIPFGEIAMVRDWMKIEAPVAKPAHEHPKRPVLGFACERSEVSGTRLWGFFRERFGSAQKFFANHYVANYCPLVFMNENGANITPDKLPADEREKLFTICDRHLARLIEILKPEFVVGVGRFAEQRARSVVEANETLQKKIAPEIITVLHPSPASPAANRDWAGTALRQLHEAGVWPS